MSLSLRCSVTRHRPEPLAHSARERDDALALVAVEGLLVRLDRLFTSAGRRQHLGQVARGIGLQLRRIGLPD